MAKPILKKNGKLLSKSNGKKYQAKRNKKGFFDWIFTKKYHYLWGKKQMSQDHNTSSAKELILALFSQNNLEYGIDKVRVKEAWVEIAGIGVVRYTEQVRLQGDKLFITLNNAALKADLSLRKTELVQLINEHLKKEVVKEVIFL